MIIALLTSARRRPSNFFPKYLIQDTKIDANSAATTDVNGTLISGIPSSSYLVINKVSSMFYQAWSRYPSDANSEGAGFPPWENRFEVSMGGHGGPSTEYWPTRYTTISEAESAAIAQPEIALTGFTSYVIWLSDDILQNRGGMSLQVSVRT